MTKLSILLFGAGLIGQAHARVLENHPDCYLAGVVDPFQNIEGVPHFKTANEAYASLKPDGVILATPNQLHEAQAIDCMRRGLPCLIEKPIAVTLQEAETIYHVQQETQVPLMVGHHRRHGAMMQEAKRIVESGVLGKLIAVQSATLFYKPDEYFNAKWRTKKGGGPVLLNLIHDVDCMRYLCGDIVEIVALGSNAYRGFEVEDTAAFVCRFENGAIGNFLVSDAACSSRSYELTSGENKVYPRQNDECYLLTGTRGSLSLPSLRVQTFDGKPSWHTPLHTAHHKIEENDPLFAQITHFAKVIRRECDPLVSAREGLETFRVIEKILACI
jgi:predicted dehydrogenase